MRNVRFIHVCALLLLGMVAQPRVASSQELSRTPLAGNKEAGKEFELAIAPTSRIASLVVNVGAWRNGATVIKGLKLICEDPAGKSQEQQAGPCDGEWHEALELPEDVQLIGVSGRHGQVLDSIRFHTSDGKMSPAFGGSGGDDEYELKLKNRDGKYRGIVRGMYGKNTADSLAGIGLVLSGIDGMPAELAEESPADAISLTIRGDIDPEIAPVVGRLATLFYQCYPQLIDRFESPRKSAPRQVTLTLKRRMEIPAFCTGAEITVSADWLKQHPGDIGLLTHELTHAVQAYPLGDPGWLVEGIADYARHVYGPQEQPGWTLPARLSAKQSYRDSYGTTARFLVWLENKHPGTVDKIHRRLQDREFAIEDFEKITGKSIDTLWNECVSELDINP